MLQGIYYDVLSFNGWSRGGSQVLAEKYGQHFPLWITKTFLVTQDAIEVVTCTVSTTADMHGRFRCGLLLNFVICTLPLRCGMAITVMRTHRPAMRLLTMYMTSHMHIIRIIVYDNFEHALTSYYRNSYNKILPMFLPSFIRPAADWRYTTMTRKSLAQFLIRSFQVYIQ